VTAEDSMYSTAACVSLYFIGRNSNPPTLTYVGEEVANFTEGQTEPVKLIVGTLTVNDPDHPTRCGHTLIQITNLMAAFSP